MLIFGLVVYKHCGVEKEDKKKIIRKKEKIGLLYGVELGAGIPDFFSKLYSSVT